jgi:hypothetical protein
MKLDDIKESPLAMTCPVFTMGLFHHTFEGLEAWDTGIQTFAGKGRTSMASPAEILFSSGWTPPSLKVFKLSPPRIGL